MERGIRKDSIMAYNEMYSVEFAEETKKIAVAMLEEKKLEAQQHHKLLQDLKDDVAKKIILLEMSQRCNENVKKAKEDLDIAYDEYRKLEQDSDYIAKSVKLQEEVEFLTIYVNAKR